MYQAPVQRAANIKHPRAATTGSKRDAGHHLQGHRLHNMLRLHITKRHVTKLVNCAIPGLGSLDSCGTHVNACERDSGRKLALRYK